jgi:pSer/pThr/pTyr-binding forkhead associated (FHA) protein
MITCPFCGAQHVANTVFCGECGGFLMEDDSPATDPLNIVEESTLQEGSDEAVSNGQTEISDASETPSVIRLVIAETDREIESDLEQDLLLGRRDPSTDTYPDVDLTHDRGAENGVSRRHAQLTKRAGKILLEDSGSINGTFVNGHRLVAYLPQVVHHGDQIKLGKLLIRVTFE